jgi:hypothetical protein
VEMLRSAVEAGLVGPQTRILPGQLHVMGALADTGRVSIVGEGVDLSLVNAAGCWYPGVASADLRHG